MATTTTVSFDQGLALYAEYLIENECIKIPCNAVYKDVRLGAWAVNQRVRKRTNELSKDEIHRLERLPGWWWNCFDRMYGIVQAYLKAHNGILPAQYTTWNDEPVGTWCDTQRQFFRRGRLSADRIQRLQALPGWTWFPKRIFTEFVQEVNQETALSSNNSRLGLWMARQRHLYHEGRLSAQRIVMLEAVPGWTWENKNERQFQQRRASLLSKPNDDLPKLGSSRLGWWLNQQRQLYQTNRLSQARIQALEAVPGWTWAGAQDEVPATDEPKDNRRRTLRMSTRVKTARRSQRLRAIRAQPY